MCHVTLEGLAGFYRGIGAVVVGSMPGVGIYLTSYEVIVHRSQFTWAMTVQTGFQTIFDEMGAQQFK